MKPETVSLLCGPGTHEPLRLDSVPGLDGSDTGSTSRCSLRGKISYT